MVTFALAFLLLHSCLGHNWINSPSRANVAGSVLPCVPRYDNQPHVQVGANQVFQLEWANHHTGASKESYFVVVKAEDLPKLTTISLNNLETYLSEAPASSLLSGTQWKKQHIWNSAQAWQASDIQFFRNAAPLDPLGSEIIQRDPTMIAKGKFSLPASSKMYAYWDNITVADKRASYSSTKYPFIESVSRFTPPRGTSSGAQYIANFVVNATSGPGDYVVWYAFVGYTDCVDVNVQAAPVATELRYGKNVTGPSNNDYIKVEHCEFRLVTEAITPCVKLPPSRSVQQCLTACSETANCTAVQVVRASVPLAGTSPWTAGFPATVYNKSQDALVNAANTGPCGSRSIHERQVAGCAVENTQCTAATLGLGPDDFVCFGLAPPVEKVAGGLLNQALEVFENALEATDPRFFSTCYWKNTDRGFTNIAPRGVAPLVPWQAGDSCVTCASRVAARNAPKEIAFDWVSGVTSTCVNCDNEAA